LHSFGNGTDGAQPSGLVFDSSGNLYGTTVSGGTDSGGTVFELSLGPNGAWTESVIYNFCTAAGASCPDGNGPMGGLTFDAAGSLYGTTSGGGGNLLSGTVFQLTYLGDGEWAEKVLYAFQGPVDVANPKAGVIFNAAGNLYGTGYNGYCVGGACDYGGVFELVPGAAGQWQETVLYGFHLGTDGGNSSAPLVIDKAGNLYGTSTFGGIVQSPSGISINGVVFALTPGPPNSLWVEMPLYSFKGSPDGTAPTSGLVMDAQGNLYGATADGGTGANGVVFEVTP
jgi:hypothetical protein